ncbi:hypothetical protein GCM10009776_00730 [Microbacterium deminutum]|uniref:Uncharacterized protein n=1 Tax=Microbacterium deminutum TaxID=344164 RepID=A0ABP5BEN7_9MICO
MRQIDELVRASLRGAVDGEVRPTERFAESSIVSTWVEQARERTAAMSTNQIHAPRARTILGAEVAGGRAVT